MGFDLALFNKVSSSNVGFKNSQDKKDAKNQKEWAEIEARAAAVRAEIEAKRAAEGESHAETDSGSVGENASALSAASRSGGAPASAGK